MHAATSLPPPPTVLLALPCRPHLAPQARCFARCKVGFLSPLHSIQRIRCFPSARIRGLSEKVLSRFHRSIPSNLMQRKRHRSLLAFQELIQSALINQAQHCLMAASTTTIELLRSLNVPYPLVQRHMLLEIHPSSSQDQVEIKNQDQIISIRFTFVADLRAAEQQTRQESKPPRRELLHISVLLGAAVVGRSRCPSNVSLLASRQRQSVG